MPSLRNSSRGIFKLQGGPGASTDLATGTGLLIVSPRSAWPRYLK